MGLALADIISRVVLHSQSFTFSTVIQMTLICLPGNQDRVPFAEELIQRLRPHGG